MTEQIHTKISDRAKEFAMNAHNSINQKRKYTNEPYHKHCERVVKILRNVTDDEEILSAAWMHDVLEDVAPLNPEFSAERIRITFGNPICDLVLELTDTMLNQGNRAKRKALDRARLAGASKKAKMIKLADLIDNFIDIQKNDPGFARVFAREMELLLPHLIEGDETLFLKLSHLLTTFNEKHKND